MPPTNQKVSAHGLRRGGDDAMAESHVQPGRELFGNIREAAVFLVHIGPGKSSISGHTMPEI